MVERRARVAGERLAEGVGSPALGREAEDRDRDLGRDLGATGVHAAVCQGARKGAESAASLLNSRSCNSGWMATIAAYWRRSSRRCSRCSAIACSPAAMASIGRASAGDRGDSVRGARRGARPPAEEHLALVLEVAEERAFGQAGALGDLRRRRRRESAFREDSSAAACRRRRAVWLPASASREILVDDVSHCHCQRYSDVSD